MSFNLLKILTLCTICHFYMSCRSQTKPVDVGDDGTGSPTVADTFSCEECSASLTSNRRLIKITLDKTEPPAATLNIFSVSGTGVGYSGSGVTPVAGGTTPADGGLVPTDATVPNIDSTELASRPFETYSATLSLAPTIPDGVDTSDLTCTFRPPYQDLDCNAESLEVSSSTIAEEDMVVEYQLNGFTFEGSTLPTKTLYIKQVSNTSGSNTLNDQPQNFFIFKDWLYFEGKNSVNRNKLFRTNGTVVEQVSNTTGDANSSDIPFPFGEYRDEYYLRLKHPSGGSKLYKTDGQDLVLLSNLRGDLSANDLSSSQFDIFNDEFYFLGMNPSNRTKLFKYNGTTFTQVSNVSGSQGVQDGISLAFEYKNHLYFNASNSNGVKKIFRTDGVSITQVSNTSGNQSTSDRSASLGTLDNHLVFVSENTSGMKKLYSYDGTNLVQLSNSQNNNAASDFPTRLFQSSEGIFWKMKNSNNADKLYLQTQGGFTKIGDLREDETQNDFISFLGSIGETPFFVATNSTGVNGSIYKYTSTGLEKLPSSVPLGQVNTPTRGVEYSGMLYFIASDSNLKTKYFATDGTEVFQVMDYTPNEQDSDGTLGNCTQLGYFETVFNSKLYFTAVVDGDTSCNVKLFSICDTDAGCQP